MANCKTCGQITPTDKNRCPKCGKMVKGLSGNPKGRPKTKIKISDKELKELGVDAIKHLEHLLKTATTRSEKERIATKLAPYQKPKLTTSKIEHTKDTNITITWDEPAKIIDIEPDKKEIDEDKDTVQAETLADSSTQEPNKI